MRCITLFMALSYNLHSYDCIFNSNFYLAGKHVLNLPGNKFTSKILPQVVERNSSM